MPKTIVADSHELSIAGLSHLVEQAFGTEPLYVVRDLASLKKVLKEEAAELLIIDPYAVRGLTADLLEQLLTDHTYIHPLVVVSEVNQADLTPLVKKGTIAIVTKNCSRREILMALEAIQHGEKFICNKVLESFLEVRTSGTGNNEEKKLSPREVEIISLIANGLSTEQIGDQLHLSPHTVHAHRKNILKKMEVATPVELVVKAIRERVISI